MSVCFAGKGNETLLFPFIKYFSSSNLWGVVHLGNKTKMEKEKKDKNHKKHGIRELRDLNSPYLLQRALI
jgi:hypothetical protein